MSSFEDLKQPDYSVMIGSQPLDRCVCVYVCEMYRCVCVYVSEMYL